MCQNNLIFFYCCLILSFIAVINGCDILKNDASPRHKIQLQNDSLFTSVNLPAVINILANDQLSGKTTLTIGQPTHGQAALIYKGKILTYTPAKDYTGRDSLTYQVCSGNNCQSAKVLLQILPDCTNRIVTYSFNKDQDLPSFSITGYDPCVNGTFQFLRKPEHGKAILDNNSFSYKPTTDYVGPDSLTIYAECPTQKQCYTVTYRFTIKNPADCRLKAADDRATIWENSNSFENQIQIRRNDDTCTAVTTTITQKPAHGEAIIDEFRHVFYVPAKNYTGPDQLTYTICNENGQCASANVYFSVKKDEAFESCRAKLAVNADKATLVRNNASVSQQLVIDILANDVLCSEYIQNYYIQITQQPQKGTATEFLDRNNQQKIRYETTTKEAGSDKLKYRLCYLSNNLVDEICKEAEVEITIK